MLAADIYKALDSLNPIALDEMDSVRLMDRTDTKFVLAANRIPELIDMIDGRYRVLEIGNNRSFTYISTYLDTSEFLFFNQHVTGKLERNKIRFRKYESTGDTWLEVKRRTNRNRTVKWRMRNEPTADSRCNDDAIRFIRDYLSDTSLELNPVLTNSFKRITLVGNSATERITIDWDLAYSIDGGKAKAFPSLSVIEVKKEGFSDRSPLENILKLLGIRRNGFSKYCVGIASLYDPPRKNILKQKLLLINKIENEYHRSIYS